MILFSTNPGLVVHAMQWMLKNFKFKFNTLYSFSVLQLPLSYDIAAGNEGANFFFF